MICVVQIKTWERQWKKAVKRKDDCNMYGLAIAVARSEWAEGLKKKSWMKIDLKATTLVWLMIEINAFYSLLFVSMSFVQICENDENDCIQKIRKNRLDLYRKDDTHSSQQHSWYFPSNSISVGFLRRSFFFFLLFLLFKIKNYWLPSFSSIEFGVSFICR